MSNDSKIFDDGGAAFPRSHSKDQHQNEKGCWAQDGMTLRDWFAGQALSGMLAYGGSIKGDYHTNASFEAAALDAYVWADAMIDVRKGKNE